MLTLALQNAVTLGFWLFALSAIGVYRASERSASPEHRTAWLLTGCAFVLHAANKSVQGVFGFLAFTRGAESRTWADYLFWNPIFNHSRTFALLGFCVAFCVVAARPALVQSGRWKPLSAAALAVGLMAGAVVGWKEEAFRELTHYSAVARWDVVELVVLLATLFVGLVTSRVDRYLWFCLCVYAFSLALNVLWFAAFSQVNIAGQWAPRPWEIHVYRSVLNAGLAWLAFHRYRLARRGVAVSGLLESRRDPQPHFIG